MLKLLHASVLGWINRAGGRGRFKYDVVDTLQEPLKMPQRTANKHNSKGKK
jgi:hypothetical protein